MLFILRSALLVCGLLFLIGRPVIGQRSDASSERTYEQEKRLMTLETTASANQVRIEMIQNDIRDMKYGLGALALMMATGLFAEVVRSVRNKNQGVNPK
jgi:hypothetical protein